MFMNVNPKNMKIRYVFNYFDTNTMMLCNAAIEQLLKNHYVPRQTSFHEHHANILSKQKLLFPIKMTCKKTHIKQV